MIDAVYILGTGSRHHDFEFRISLASLYKNGLNLRNVFVIGERPRHATPKDMPYTYLPAPDPSHDKQQNAHAKLLRAARLAPVSDRFVLMNDDFFIREPVDLENIPYYRQGRIQEHIEWRKERKSKYYFSLCQTRLELLSRGFNDWDFELHVPIVYERRHLHRVLTELFNFSFSPAPLIRSLYANSIGAEGVPLDDCKIDSPCSVPEIQRRVRHRSFFSIGDGGLTANMRHFLISAYVPSQPSSVFPRSGSSVHKLYSA